MKNFFLAALALPALILSGCIDASSHIHVNKDGSGTITETVLMDKQAANAISSMAAGMTEAFSGEASTATPAPTNWWKKEDLEKRAAQIGEGVTFQNVEVFETDTGSGYKATFAFTDINKISIQPDPNSRAPEQPNQDGEITEEQPEETPAREELITFSFTPGNPARLTINMPKVQKSQQSDTSNQTDSSAADAQTTDAIQEAFQPAANLFAENMMGAMGGAMSQMFKGMRTRSTISVEGDITDTNAAHRDGSTVTLMEIDFEKFLSDSETMKKLMQNENASFTENLAVLQDNPNIKYDTNEQITIQFR